MTIALASLPGATIETGVTTAGTGIIQYRWDGAAWTYYDGSCTTGDPSPPSTPGTTYGELQYGSCLIRETQPISVLIHTLLQDPDGVVDDLVEKYHTPTLSRLLCQSAATRIPRGTDTLIPNYEPTPEPKINQLVIPTGSTRWAYCLLLANDEIKDRIYEASANGTQAMNLVFGTAIGSEQENSHAISLTVHTLPPRRLSPDNGPAGDDPGYCVYTWDGVSWILTSNACKYGSPIAPGGVGPFVTATQNGHCPLNPASDLWIIPVVDERYYWQTRHTGALADDITTEDITTPDQLVQWMLDMSWVDATLNVTVNPLHTLLPSCATTNDYENMPIVMDSIFAHYGQRLVVDIGCWNSGKYGGSYESVTVETPPPGITRYAVLDGHNSSWVHYANFQGTLGLAACDWSDGRIADQNSSAVLGTHTVGTPHLVAGGHSSAYPYTTPYGSPPDSVDIQTTDGVYVNKTAASVSLTRLKPVSTGGPAIWRTKFDEDPPSLMVSAMAVDYYYQYALQYDFTFAGVQPWQQGYFDDYMVYRQTWNPKTKAYDAYTRVCSRQPNLTGEWTQNAPAAVGSQRIYFEVTDYECISSTEVELTVMAIWYTGGCTADIPGEDSYGSITVIDPCGKALFFAAEDLTGKNGFATYMYPRAGYCEPRWLLDDLCGQPEC